MKKMLLAIMRCAAATPFSYAADSFLVGRLSTPLLASASWGVRFGDKTGNLRPSMQAEAGIGGGKLALGFDSTGDAGFGFGLKASFLRTWMEPIDVDEDQDFLGVEGEFSIKRLILNVGGYRRVGNGADDWLTSAGVGFIF
jgi:hypothetical protein